MLSFISLPLLALVSTVAQAAAPIKPSSDPFYVPDAGFAGKAAGTILRQRTISPANLGLSTNFVQATQLLFRTRMINGTAIAAVTTVFKPNNAQSGKFVSYQVAEDASFIDCAPSYGLQSGSDNTNPTIGGAGTPLQLYLSQGLVVAAPDHEGPDASFASRVGGYITLDGMRAVQTFLGGNQIIVGAGYSGGAIATGWAASLHSGYANELNIKGWTIGGTPANLTSTLLFQDKGFFAGFAPIAIAGLNKPSAYKDVLNKRLQEILTQQGKDQVALAEKRCVGDALLPFIGKSILSTDFQTLGPALLNDGTIQFVLLGTQMGFFSSEKPKAPVLLYHAQTDEIIPYNSASKLKDDWCAQGAAVHFATYKAGGHFTTEVTALPQVMFYTNYFFSQPALTSCSTQQI